MADPLRLLRDDDSSSLERVIDHHRYEVGGQIGAGKWGRVYEAKDGLLGGKKVAIKVLTVNGEGYPVSVNGEVAPKDAIRAEGTMAAAAYRVPRRADVDANGTPFFVMPFYREFFDQRIQDDGFLRRSVANKSLELETAADYILNLTRGIDELHRTEGYAHTDLKPDNIAIDADGNLLLNDLGGAIVNSLRGEKRDTSKGGKGAWYTRAPEIFLGEQKMNLSRDVWSVGAIAYRLFTGEYPLEAELRDHKNPEAYMAELGTEGVDKLIKQKIKKNLRGGSRRLEKIIRECLHADPQARPHSSELPGMIRHAMDKYAFVKDVWRLVKRSTVAAVAASVLGGLGYITVNPPETMPDPEPPKVSGMLFLEEYGPNGRTVFDIEESQNLPSAEDIMLNHGTTRYAAQSSDNKSIAFLVDMHKRAWEQARGDMVTKHQKKIFHQRATKEDFEAGTFSGDREDGYDVYRMPARALEAAFEELQGADGSYINELVSLDPRFVRYTPIKTLEGRIDLEDLMVAGRYGFQRLQQAKNIANSQFFRDYIETHVFADDQRNFMKTWLAHVHSRLARK